MGQIQRTEGRSDQPPSVDVTSRPQAHCRRSEGEMGAVEGEAGMTPFA